MKAVLIGGGITGVLTARELLGRGWECTIVEAAHVGAGSSSRTAAGIRQQFSTADTVRGMRYSVAFYRAFAAECEGRSPIVQNGYLFLHAEAQAWEAAQARIAVQRGAGLVEVEALAGDELRRRFPWVGPGVLGGTFCPTDGFLRPEMVYGDGARRVRELGGTILQGARVEGVREAGGRLTAVVTPKGEVEGDVFLDCTNAWSPRLARVLGAEVLPVAPLKRYLWFLQRAGSFDPAAFDAMPLTIAPTGVYVRPENHTTLMMGLAHDAAPEPDFSYDDQDRIDPGFAHNSGFDGLAFDAWAKIADAVPAVGEFAGIAATTSGFYGTTPDHNPFFGFDRLRPNLIRLVGFSGHGAMFGPFSARVGATLAEAGDDVDRVDVGGESVSIDAFRIGRAFGHAEAMVI